jgi:hypothetical protein
LIARLLEDVGEPLGDLSRHYFYGKRSPEQSDSSSKKLSESAKALLSVLDFSAESPIHQAILKREEATLRNFRKMLQAYVGKDTWAEMEPVIKAQGTKTKIPWEKFRDYSQLVTSIVASFDTEVDTTFRVGPYNVAVITNAHGDWDDDRIEALKWILNQSVHVLQRIGMGKMAYGTVIAYASRVLPAAASLSHSTLASYSPRNDDIRIAVNTESARETLHSMIHELGHRAHFRLVENQGRSAWKEFFDSNQGDPDVDGIIRDWEAFAQKDKHGAWLAYFYNDLKKKGDDRLMWLEMLATKLKIKEDFDQMTGYPKKTKANKPGLEQLKEKRNEAKVFMYPVTAYSGKNAEELFAETFAALATQGGSHVPEIVLDAFKRTIPSARFAAERSYPTGLEWRPSTGGYARTAI